MIPEELIQEWEDNDVLRQFEASGRRSLQRRRQRSVYLDAVLMIAAGFGVMYVCILIAVWWVI